MECIIVYTVNLFTQIPSDGPIKFKLTTEWFKLFIPDLNKAYPDKNLTLWIDTAKPILFNVNKAGKLPSFSVIDVIS